MKAAVYYQTGGPEVLTYEDVAEPLLRPGGVLIDVAAIAIQGGDTLNRTGGALATKPHIVGYQASGIVREVGEGVTSFTKGQHVVATMGFGSHAEVISVPAAAVWAVPAG
ncbi:MAG: zinc-binding alcohol dehydrogenase family protein, partial [Actinomycetota bacterium]